MIFAAICTALICSALFAGAVYLLIWGDKPEAPTWESFINDSVKYWKKK